MKCRRKPIELECWPVEKILFDPKIAPEWVTKCAFEGKLEIKCPDEGSPSLSARTQEGWLNAPHDGYIIQGVEGKIWPIGASQFAKTYDLIE